MASFDRRRGSSRLSGTGWRQVKSQFRKRDEDGYFRNRQHRRSREEEVGRLATLSSWNRSIWHQGRQRRHRPLLIHLLTTDGPGPTKTSFRDAVKQKQSAGSEFGRAMIGLGASTTIASIGLVSAAGACNACLSTSGGPHTCIGNISPTVLVSIEI